MRRENTGQQETQGSEHLNTKPRFSQLHPNSSSCNVSPGQAVVLVISYPEFGVLYCHVHIFISLNEVDVGMSGVDLLFFILLLLSNSLKKL